MTTKAALTGLALLLARPLELALLALLSLLALLTLALLSLPRELGPHPEDVAHMKRTADRLFGDQYRWSVLGAGRNQLPIAAMAAAMGGNVRVGLEDSLWSGPGRLAQSNAEQVGTIRKVIEGLSLEVATPEEARTLLALKGGDDVNF